MKSRAVARIFGEGNFGLKERSPRPVEPRAGVGFLGRGKPAVSPPAIGLGSAVRSQAGSGTEPRPSNGFTRV